MEDYGSVFSQVPATSSEQSTAPAATSEETVPSVPAVSSLPASSQKVGATGLPEPVAIEDSGLITVETDLFKVKISPRGGTIQNIYLLNYPVSPDAPEKKLQLLKPDYPNLYLAQSGLIGASKDTAPTHEAIFQASNTEYRLTDGSNELAVELSWTHDSGLKIIKRYQFKRGSYLIDLTQEVNNQSDSNWAARSYVQLQRSEPYDPKKSSFIYTFTGAAYYSPEYKYEKVPFEDIIDNKISLEVNDGWVAMLQHYFLSAWIPPRGETRTIFTNQLSGPRYVIGMYSPTVAVQPGGSHSFSSQFYAGPKLQNELAKVADGLELSVDYGWLTILAQPIFWLLNKLHSLVNNWGVAIILLTILIKLAFYKLSETSYKSMANMRKLTPRLQALKDRYGDDKERLNQAMMEMYKKEKINPLGGCLPIVVQIPVFIALYWVLLESVEMRHAPFALWINNLSAPDPYFILPLIMGVSMFIQQKLNPAPVDPIQAKIMMSLPVVFTVFFAFFPSGLVLYWTVNNLLSIAQQWHITRNIEKAAKSH